MRRRCADKPRGCAESSCPKHSAHPLGLSAHLKMRKLLAFLSCCGARGASDLVGSPSYYHQLTSFHSSMSQRRIIIPSGCAESACLTHSAHPLGLSAHLIIMDIFCFLCCYGHHLGLVRPQEFSLPPTHEFNLAISRCAGDAPTNQEDAPKAPVLSIRRIHLPGRRIPKCEHY
jgi:hypothetical protein